MLGFRVSDLPESAPVAALEGGRRRAGSWIGSVLFR